MDPQKFIEKFLEEYQENHTDLFLYKDKQLLKKNDYKQFAERQLRKANKIYWFILPSVVFVFIWGIINLIKYGETQNWIDLTFGLACLILFTVAVIQATKEYYSIKTSMRVFIQTFDTP